MGRRAQSLAERLERHTRLDASSGCRVWTGHRDVFGYGRITVGGRSEGAHRVAYALVKGGVPDGLVIDHLCRNRGCVEVSHLEAVPQRTNVLRGASQIAANLEKAECAHGHPFDDANTYRYRGARYCRACNRATVARRKSQP